MANNNHAELQPEWAAMPLGQQRTRTNANGGASVQRCRETDSRGAAREGDGPPGEGDGYRCEVPSCAVWCKSRRGLRQHQTRQAHGEWFELNRKDRLIVDEAISTVNSDADGSLPAPLSKEGPTTVLGRNDGSTEMSAPILLEECDLPIGKGRPHHLGDEKDKPVLGFLKKVLPPISRQESTAYFTHSRRGVQNSAIDVATEINLKVDWRNAADTKRYAEMNVLLRDAREGKSWDEIINQFETVNEAEQYRVKLINQTGEMCFGVKEESPVRRKSDNLAGRNKKLSAELRDVMRQTRTIYRSVHRLRRSGGEDTEAYECECFKIYREAAKQLAKFNKWARNAKRDGFGDVLMAEKQNAEFRKNPVEFIKKLFSGDEASEGPTFSQQVAEDYMKREMSDSERDVCKLPSDLGRAPTPRVPFEMDRDRTAIRKSILRTRRNGAAGGITGTTYVVYKSVPEAEESMWAIHDRQIKERHTADIHGIGERVCVSKGKGSDKPESMRWLTMFSVEGRTFWAVEARVFQNFVYANNYVPKDINKAFAPGVAGCTEHGVFMHELTQDAMRRKRALGLGYGDVESAFPAVRHQQLQCMCWYFHIPEGWAKLLFSYYERIVARCRSSNWVTGFSRMLIALGQGCGGSPGLFVGIYQMFIDYFDKMMAMIIPVPYGYHFEDADATVDKSLFADDLVHLTADVEWPIRIGSVHHKQLIDCGWEEEPRRKGEAAEISTVKLSAAGVLKAIGFVLPRASEAFHVKFRPEKGRDLVHRFRWVEVDGEWRWKYGPDDPLVTIDGVKVKCFLSDDSQIFRYVGTPQQTDGKQDLMFALTESKVKAVVDKVAGTSLTGIRKAYALSMKLRWDCTWDCMTVNAPDTTIKRLDALVMRHYKAWTGVRIRQDKGPLILPVAKRGLGLTRLETVSKQTRVCVAHIMKHSEDVKCRNLYTSQVERIGRGRRKAETSGPAMLERLEAEFEVEFANDGLRYQFRQGIGAGEKKPVTRKEKRALLCARVKEEDAEALLRHTDGLVMEGEWRKWTAGRVQSEKLTYQAMCLDMTESMTKYILQAQGNNLADGWNLVRWNKCTAENPMCHCPLCGKHKYSASHILGGGCDFIFSRGKFEGRGDAELNGQNRVTWRHDCTLRSIAMDLCEVVARVNALPPGVDPKSRDILLRARDWEVLVDLPDFNDGGRVSFPMEFGVYDGYPDILLVSLREKLLVSVELTVPHESNMASWNVTKSKKYLPLLNVNSDWKVPLLGAIEFGATIGAANSSVDDCMRKLGLSKTERKLLTKHAMEVTRLGSARVWFSRHSKQFRNAAIYASGKTAEDLNDVYSKMLRSRVYNKTITVSQVRLIEQNRRRALQIRRGKTAIAKQFVKEDGSAVADAPCEAELVDHGEWLMMAPVRVSSKPTKSRAVFNKNWCLSCGAVVRTQDRNTHLMSASHRRKWGKSSIAETRLSIEADAVSADNRVLDTALVTVGCAQVGWEVHWVWKDVLLVARVRGKWKRVCDQTWVWQIDMPNGDFCDVEWRELNTARRRWLLAAKDDGNISSPRRAITAFLAASKRASSSRDESGQNTLRLSTDGGVKRWKLQVSAKLGRWVLSITDGCAEHKTDGSIGDGVTSLPSGMDGARARAVEFLEEMEDVYGNLSSSDDEGDSPPVLDMSCLSWVLMRQVASYCDMRQLKSLSTASKSLRTVVKSMPRWVEARGLELRSQAMLQTGALDEASGSTAYYSARQLSEQAEQHYMDALCGNWAPVEWGALILSFGWEHKRDVCAIGVALSTPTYDMESSVWFGRLMSGWRNIQMRKCIRRWRSARVTIRTRDRLWKALQRLAWAKLQQSDLGEGVRYEYGVMSIIAAMLADCEFDVTSYDQQPLAVVRGVPTGESTVAIPWSYDMAMSEPEPEWRPHRPLGPVGMAQLAIVRWREKAARWETIGPGKWRVSAITFRQQIEIEMDQEADLIALQWAKHRGDYLLDHRVRYRGGRVRRHCFGLWKQFKPRLARAILHMVVQKCLSGREDWCYDWSMMIVDLLALRRIDHRRVLDEWSAACQLDVSVESYGSSEPEPTSSVSSPDFARLGTMIAMGSVRVHRRVLEEESPGRRQEELELDQILARNIELQLESEPMPCVAEPSAELSCAVAEIDWSTVDGEHIDEMFVNAEQSAYQRRQEQELDDELEYEIDQHIQLEDELR